MLPYLSPLVRQYVLVVTANLAIITTGMSVAWPSPSLVKLSCPIETPLARPITVEEGSWIVSSGCLAAAAACVLGGMLIDVIGRRNCILLFSVPKVCMAVFLIFASEVWMYILCRITMVSVDGLLFTIIPIYSSEIARDDHRGSLGTLLQLFSSTGILFTLSVGPYLSYRTFSIVFASTITALTVPLLFLPETPYHMFSKGKIKEATKILTMIRDSEKLVNEELESYMVSTTHNNSEKINRRALFKKKTFLKALSLSVVLSFASQVMGFNGVNFYLQTILEASHTSVPSETASVIIGVIQIVACFCTTLVMHRFGRRTILLYSLVGYFFGMLGLGAFFQITKTEGYLISGLINYLPIISIIAIIVFNNVGIGSLLFVIVAELFDGPSRATGVTISIATVMFTAFVITKYFALMTIVLGPGLTYWFFCIMTIVFFIVILVFLPETKGKSFNEIQEILCNTSINDDDNKSEAHM